MLPAELFDERYWHREIADAIQTPDPSLSNRKITLVHYKLSRALQQVTGADSGANFHTWAVWGSRKAGITIRQEDLGEALYNATVVAGIVGLLVGAIGSLVSINLWLTGWHWLIVVPSAVVGAVCGAFTGRGIATYSRREAARLVLEGNRTVLDDIGKQTARFVATFHNRKEPDPNALNAFLSTLRPGKTQFGGQDLLRQAFTQYYTARYAADLKRKHEANYFANCLAVLHEHIRLEPYIKKSMPLIIRKCATKRMMQFDVGFVTLKVSEEVPPLNDLEFPTSLQTLSDRDLMMFLEGEQGWGGNRKRSRANDWTNIRERMRYIVQLFRVMHLEAAVFSEPYAKEPSVGSLKR